MSTPDPSPHFSSAARWGLPALAVLTVLGVIIALTLFSGSDKPAAKNLSSEQAQPQTDHSSVAATTGASVPVMPAPSVAPSATAQLAVPTVAKAAPLATSLNTPAVAAVRADAQSSDSLTDALSADQPLDPGEPAKARVTVGGVRTPVLSPNQVGSFPRVLILPG